MLTKHQLKDSRFWGSGFCLRCLEPEADIENNNAQECSSCGSVTVVSAQTILNLIARIEPDDGD